MSSAMWLTYSASWFGRAMLGAGGRELGPAGWQGKVEGAAVRQGDELVEA